MGEVKASPRYGAVVTGGECEVKQELEVDTRQNVWDDARGVEIALDLRNILASAIHEAVNSQSKRDREDRLHSYQVRKGERGRKTWGMDATPFTIVYSWISVCHQVWSPECGTPTLGEL